MNTNPLPIVLDTDIGDDIDDAYALALILASPELDLRGITTVFKNTRARARQARTILEIAGRRDVPVAAGSNGVLSPRITYGEPFATRSTEHGERRIPTPAAAALADERPRQDASAFPEEKLPPLHPAHGVDLLIELLSEGSVIPVTIGAMTNLAMSLIKEPRLLETIPRIVCMAGCFDRQLSEWNIRCDPVAASIVFSSGIPVTVVGLDVTMRCRFNAEQVKRLHESDRPVAKNLSTATREWAERTRGGWKKGFPVLHDPLAILTLIDPDLVATRNGTVTVDTGNGEAYGYTLFHPSVVTGEPGVFRPKDGERHESGQGIHEVCVDVDAGRALEMWLDRVFSL